MEPATLKLTEKFRNLPFQTKLQLAIRLGLDKSSVWNIRDFQAKLNSDPNLDEFFPLEYIVVELEAHGWKVMPGSDGQDYYHKTNPNLPKYMKEENPQHGPGDG